VGTLVRAVVGTVGRKHPAAAARDRSGPPQEWLDLVAETDPEWLARSEWADRAPRPPREARWSGGPSEPPRLIEPEWEPGDESSQQPRPGVLRWPAPKRSVPTSADVEQDEEPPVVTPRRAERPVRRLQSVAQPDEAEAIEDTAPPVRRRREPAPATTPDRPRDDVRPAPEVPAREHRVAEPIVTHEPPRHATEASAVAATPPTPPARQSSEALSPVPDLAAYEPVRTVVERSRLASVHLLPPDRATESRSTTLDGEAPDRLHSAQPSPWPELPHTDSLDEQTPGLASRLWLADDRADALTTAQRRT
jgi:hypothetical protein